MIICNRMLKQYLFIGLYNVSAADALYYIACWRGSTQCSVNEHLRRTIVWTSLIIFVDLCDRSSGGSAAPPPTQAPPDVPTMVGVTGSMYPQINPIDKLYLMQNSYFDHWRQPLSRPPDTLKLGGVVASLKESETRGLPSQLPEGTTAPGVAGCLPRVGAMPVAGSLPRLGGLPGVGGLPTWEFPF